MKMTVQELMDRTIMLSTIIKENRRLPTKGKYWLSRMHAKLLPVFNKYNSERDAKIAAFNYYPEVPNPAAAHITDEMREAMIAEGHLAKLPPKTITSPVQAVPPEAHDQFIADWIEVGKEVIDVPVKPINVDVLCFPGDLEDGEITAHEFIVLGDLIYEGEVPTA